MGFTGPMAEWADKSSKKETKDWSCWHTFEDYSTESLQEPWDSSSKSMPCVSLLKLKDTVVKFWDRNCWNSP